jgi:Zn/Cd-binding protein ZinT
MTNEKLEFMLDCGMAIIREKDIKTCAMNENFEPFNHLLSAEENKRCWNYLAKQYVMNTLNIAIKNKTLQFYEQAITSNKFYDTWILFLQAVENVVRYGQKNKGIENIVNHSGISRETFVMFLD